MDLLEKNFELISENMSSVRKGLKIMDDILSSKRSISEKEFVLFCSFIRDLNFFVNEYEFHVRTLPSTDDFMEMLSIMRRDFKSLVDDVKKKRSLKNE